MSRVAPRLAHGCLLVLLAGAAQAAAPLQVASPQAADAPAHAAAMPVAPQPQRAAATDAALAGDYRLTGIMETGSQLRLRADGRFQWYFSYGALDLAAQGRWSRQADTVVLVPESFQAPPGYEGMAFERLRLRLDGNALIPAWPWDDGNERGSYVRD